jgi:hypothetical protein
MPSPDSSDRFGRVVRQARGCEMAIVQRDGCVKPQMSHAVIIGKSG